MSHFKTQNRDLRLSLWNCYSNSFDTLGSISFLFICPRLENLVLKGNPVSRMEDYRLRVFNMLPNLKNLDVILIQRAPRTVCRRDPEDEEKDHDQDSGAAPVTNSEPDKTSNIPKELEGMHATQRKISLFKCQS